MALYWQVFMVGMATALLFTPVVRRMALALGAVDRPVARSVHKQPVPLLGGLAIFVAFAVSVLYGLDVAKPEVQGIVLGGAFVVLFGILDDYVILSPRQKLLGQVMAASILLLFDVRIDRITNPFGGMVDLGVWGVPLTILWVVAVINVINLIDGLDGLAAGVSCIAALTLLFAALETQQPAPAVLLAAALAGSALGFLPFNFNPAKIFMGDAGSMFLGFALAAVSVEGSLKSPALVALVVPVLALGIPILDTSLAIVRRWRSHRPIGEADKEHLHHRLLNLGLSQRDAVLLIYLGSGWLGVSALAIAGVSTRLALVILTFVGFSLYFVARKVGMLSPRAGQRGVRL